MKHPTQQEALYAAQGEALSSLGRRFASLKAVRAYVQAVTETEEWSERCPVQACVEVHSSAGDRKWAGWADTDSHAIWTSLDEQVILHELAHLLTPRQGHGPGFARAYLELVREHMGFHAYGALRAAFSAHGVLT